MSALPQTDKHCGFHDIPYTCCVCLCHSFCNVHGKHLGLVWIILTILFLERQLLVLNACPVTSRTSL